MNKMDHVVSTNINSNQVNGVTKNELEFDSSNSIANIHIKDNKHIVTVSLRGGNKSRHTLKLSLTCLWNSEFTGIMIKCKHINYYKSKIRGNKVNCSTAAGSYTTTHDAKVPFSMLELSSRNIIIHCFHTYNEQGGEGIGHAIII